MKTDKVLMKLIVGEIDRLTSKQSQIVVRSKVSFFIYLVPELRWQEFGQREITVSGRN